MHANTHLSQFAQTVSQEGPAIVAWEPASTEGSVVDWVAEKLAKPREEAISRLVALLLAVHDVLRAKGISSLHDPRVDESVCHQVP